MTDLKDRFILLLAGEPASPDDLAALIGEGRRARRRRSVLTSAAATAGATALVAVVAVPVSLASGSAPTSASVATQPSPTAAAHHCKWYRATKGDAKKVEKRGTTGNVRVIVKKEHGHKYVVYTCRVKGKS
jgi:hypothetical protein